MVGFILLAIGVLGFAENDVGNGGGSVVCRDAQKQIVSAEVFDVFEARIFRNIKPELGSSLWSYQKKIDYALNRLEKIAPEKAKYYQERQKFFFENVSFVSSGLAGIPDLGNVVIPEGCGVEQLAIRKEPQLPGDTWFYVSKPIWDRLDEDNRAAIVLHEIVYEDAVERGYKSSLVARYINSLIFSAEAEKMGEKAFEKLLIRHVLSEYTAGFKPVFSTMMAFYFPNLKMTASDAEVFCKSVSKEMKINTVSSSLCLLDRFEELITGKARWTGSSVGGPYSVYQSDRCGENEIEVVPQPQTAYVHCIWNAKLVGG